MGEKMRPVAFGKLMRWTLEECRGQRRVFGVEKDKFYHNPEGGQLEMFGERLAAPLGPAAGPNSQLAQNIVAAFLAGARFMELKTVQKMDGAELAACVPRPCINAQDEGYNVEWSTELTVPQALDEYVKAWMMVHVLGRELGISAPGEGPGVIFNMSVGYDLEGIKAPKIDGFIEGMKNAASLPVWQDAMAWLREHLHLFEHFGEADLALVPPRVSASVTLSTLHGCPPDEIERIARYLLDEKGLHTFVKCNPTLLGYPTARRLLDEMGFDYVSFDEHHFQNDLQYADAVAMFERLLAHAGERGLAFGVKITNTFPVKIERGELPGEEMYMSGRALLPLSLNVANKLAADFGGGLPISYSGGADAFNIGDIFMAGIRPITVATTLLKPGGYERLKQLAETLEPLLQEAPEAVDAAALQALCGSLAGKAPYRKESRPVKSRKTQNKLPAFDCYTAPCREGGCPIEQQIPEYLRLVAEEKYDEAFRVIAVDNANPGITGAICNHACQGKCTRLDYDTPLGIRQAKRIAGDWAQSVYTAGIQPCEIKTDKRAVVVGAGPAGISAALYLRRNGVDVTVLEKRERPFGIVEYVIPAFRISPEVIRRDYEMAVKTGVRFRFGTEAGDVAALQKEYDFVILAIGAWGEGAPAVAEGNELTLDALAFLEQSKASDCQVELGRRVAVVGGGDVAMDCARAAKRAPGVENVTLVYRRTREFMPAEPEEIRLALEEGVEMVELHAPKRYDGDCLCCEVMELGDWDESGRRGITGTGAEKTLHFDTLICAVGARVDTALFAAAGIEMDRRGRPAVNAACESSLPGVYITGDCKAEPATVVAAMGDAKRAVMDILGKLGLPHDFVRLRQPQPAQQLYARKGVLLEGSDDHRDGARCLSCDQLCELCCDVCPNRANVRIPLGGFENAAQILHLDALCNECGNCGIFCPYVGNPYKDKTTLFSSEEDFADSTNAGFLKLEGKGYRIRTEDGEVFEAVLEDERMPRRMAGMIQTLEEQYSYYFV